MAVNVNFSINVSWEELRRLSPEQCDAFMRGVAACVSANPYADDNKRLAEKAAEWLNAAPDSILHH